MLEIVDQANILEIFRMIKRFIRKLPMQLRNNSKIVLMLSAISTMDYTFSRNIKDSARIYGRVHGVRNDRGLKNDIKQSYIEGPFSLDEYIDFEFFEKEKKERMQYVSLKELLKEFSRGEKNTFPRDKFERYLLFKDYYLRDVIRISIERSGVYKNEFNRFLQLHDTFVLKPIKGTKGP